VSTLRTSVETAAVLRLLAVSSVPAGMSALASTTVAVVTGGAVAVLVVPEPVDGVLLVYSMAR
jgi:uncharacterized membrane protein